MTMTQFKDYIIDLELKEFISLFTENEFDEDIDPELVPNILKIKLFKHNDLKKYDLDDEFAVRYLEDGSHSYMSFGGSKNIELKYVLNKNKLNKSKLNNYPFLCNI